MRYLKRVAGVWFVSTNNEQKQFATLKAALEYLLK